MHQPTIAVRVLDELRRSGLALDDEELAHRLAVGSRQTINQVCRRLERAGRLHRYIGAGGRIVNDLRRGADDHGPQPAAVAGSAITLPARLDFSKGVAGDSQEQRQAELVMLDQLGQHCGVVLRPRSIPLEDGVRVEVDGADDGMTLLVEAWAHRGPSEPARENEVLADALKLLYVAATLPVAPRLVLCLSDPEVAHRFTSARSWAAHALRYFGIEVVVVELPPELDAAVLAAEERQ